MPRWLPAPFLFLAACSSTPPPGWAEGGAPLLLGEATWQTSDGDPIEIRADGKVLVDGDPMFGLDRAGRVFDEDKEPIAVLLPDGHLAGSDDVLLGRIGLANASPPGRATAWVSILPTGAVVFFDSDGERSSLGTWRGCDGPELRTCTLVTHLVLLQRALAAQRSSFSVGVGVGVWH